MQFLLLLLLLFLLLLLQLKPCLQCFSALVARLQLHYEPLSVNDCPNAARMRRGRREALSLMFFTAPSGRRKSPSGSLVTLGADVSAGGSAGRGERARWWRSEESLASLSWACLCGKNIKYSPSFLSQFFFFFFVPMVFLRMSVVFNWSIIFTCWRRKSCCLDFLTFIDSTFQLLKVHF